MQDDKPVRTQAIMRLVLLSQSLHRGPLAPLGRLVDGAVRVGFSAVIPGRAQIAADVFFHHSGIGVVINGASVIETGCEIGVGVVLGGRAPLTGAPYLEQNVIVHAGAKLIGPIRVGRGSVIAANAVVLTDVPPGSLVAGVPGAIKRTGLETESYRTTSGNRELSE